MEPDSSARIEQSLGNFAKLPAEIRIQIWELLLLADCNEVDAEPSSSEPPVVVNGSRLNYKNIQCFLTERGEKMQPDSGPTSYQHSDDTVEDDSTDDEDDISTENLRHDNWPQLNLAHAYYLNVAIMRASKLLHYETFPILYARNLWVQLRLFRDEALDWFVNPWIVESSAMHFYTLDFFQAELASWNAMNIDLTGGDRDASQPVFMFPASQIPLLVTKLSSMLVGPGIQLDEETFGHEYGIELLLRHDFGVDHSELEDRLLQPFDALTGFRDSSVRAEFNSHRLDIHGGLEASLAVPEYNAQLWYDRMISDHFELLSTASQTGMRGRARQRAVAVDTNLGQGKRLYVLSPDLSDGQMLTLAEIHMSTFLILCYCRLRLSNYPAMKMDQPLKEVLRDVEDLVYQTNMKADVSGSAGSEMYSVDLNTLRAALCYKLGRLDQAESVMSHVLSSSVAEEYHLHLHEVYKVELRGA